MSATPLPNELKTFMASVIFPVKFNYPLHGYVKPWDTPTLKSPKLNSSYVWSEDLITTMVLFWFSGETSLKLIGHTGTGKTEAVFQFHAALNLPLVMLTANPQTAARDLIGGFYPTATGYAWRDGPVTMAARNGLSVLIDEYNVIDPGEASGLNAFLEGRAFTIQETGETIVPKHGFRIYATINPKASGYAGRNNQDLANDDRFIDVHTQYPSKDIEVKTLTDYLLSMKSDPGLAGNIAVAIATGADVIRKSYMGENDDANALPCTMSMRGTMRWAKWTHLITLAYEKTGTPESPIYMALDKVLANRQRPEIREALRNAFQLSTGIKP